MRKFEMNDSVLRQQLAHLADQARKATAADFVFLLVADHSREENSVMQVVAFKDEPENRHQVAEHLAIAISEIAHALEVMLPPEIKLILRSPDGTEMPITHTRKEIKIESHN